MNLYIAVELDEYELPVAVAEPPGELAKMLGVTKNAVLSGISNAKKNKTRCRYRKIKVSGRD